jgi:hypothetical protein
MVPGTTYVMGLTYVLDREQRIVRSRGAGVLTMRELQDFYSRLLTDRRFEPDFRGLGDLRGVTEISIESSGLAEAASLPVFGEHAKRALVATNDAVYGMARAYASFTERMSQTVRVFRSMKVAEAWLNEQSA